MSGKGNCLDKACAESFFHSLKIEVIHGERFASRDQLRQVAFQYIEIGYDHVEAILGLLLRHNHCAKRRATLLVKWVTLPVQIGPQQAILNCCRSIQVNMHRKKS